MRRNKALNEDNLIVSQELALAATLVCLDFPLIDMRQIDSKKVAFVFERSDDIADVMDGFWKDTIVCSPKKYFYTLKELKSRIYSFRNSNNNFDLRGGDTKQ